MSGKTPTHRRIGILLVIIFAVFVLLIGRLLWVQTVQGGVLSEKAQNIQTKSITLAPQRGNIYDRNNNLLVTSLPAYSIYASPNLMKDPAAVATKIAPLLGLDANQLTANLKSKKSFVWIKRDVDWDVGQKIKQMKLTGLGFVDSAKRSYPQGRLAASVLGFVGSDDQGLVGIEKSYNRQLAGTPGEMLVMTDADGRVLPDTEKTVTPVVPGDQLVLALDQTMQFYVERELDKINAAYSPLHAVILVMNPNTGEVLAMGNSPGFEPAKWQSYPPAVWQSNLATTYAYEPGSVFKLFTTAAALSNRIVSPNDYFYDPGCLVVQGHNIYDSERQDYGAVTFEKGLEDSLNIVFAQVGQKVGAKTFYEYIRGFGFGSPTGIDLPGDEPGLVTPEDKCTTLNLSEMSFGQAIAVTPLQVLTATCAIANGGKLMQPHMVKEIKDNHGKVIKEFTPEVVRQVISADTAKEETQMMENVVVNGTGQNAVVDGYSVAGKTGTAQVPGPGGYVPDKYVSSFVGFAPANNPQIAVLVMVDQPHNAYYGGDVAAPIFSDLTGKILNYLGIPKDPSLISQNNNSNQQPVATSNNKIPVPNLTNYPVAEARWLLAVEGFNCTNQENTGIVTDQNPKPGTYVSPGSYDSLQVSGSLAGLGVPDLTGLTMKKAGIVLADLGLHLVVQGNGLASGQNPPPGTPVSPGATVTVTFSDSKQ